ncbi:MAG: WG repeat-containing protein [Prevotella sp.]|nr:WG repeat-containing protein [Prevotella sp.]
MTKTDYHIFVENGKVGLKDAADRVVLFAVYDGINFTDTKTPICVCRDGKWGLTDARGRIIVDPKYDNIYCPCNDRIAVCTEEKWGYIDYKGKEIIPLIYDDALEFINAEYCFGTPCAWVQKDGKWGTINTTGEVVIPFEYDSADELNGVIIVEKNGKSGIINHKNEFIMPLGDNVINMLDDHIVSFSGDELCGAINLSTNERYEFDYDIEEYAFSDGFAIVDNADKKNVVDRKFNVILPEWHDEIVLLENRKILLIDEDKCVLYDTANGKSQECHQDDDYAYLPDGKTMYCKTNCMDTIHVKAGIENLAYLAHDEEAPDYVKYQQIYDLKTVKFDEGVTTIGTGWEELDLSPCLYDPQVDIFLPSTLKKMHPKAFSDMVTIIRDIYVPYGMADAMRPILPSHLHPFVKEGTKGIARVFDGVRTEGFSSDPFSLYFQMAMKMPKKLQEYSGVILIILMFIPLWGFALTRDAVLPVDSFSMTVIICIAIISAIISIIVKRKHAKEYKGFFWCMFGWAVVLFAICGTFLFLFLAANNFIGGGEQKYTYGEIIKLTESGKDTKIEINIPKFDKTIPRSFSTPIRYKEGDNCRIKYHKGLFGIYVIDEDIE